MTGKREAVSILALFVLTSCGGSQGNNVLEMYRSPVTGLEPTAGIEFGPANHVSGLNTCNEGIMGNNEVSPIATTLGFFSSFFSLSASAGHSVGPTWCAWCG